MEYFLRQVVLILPLVGFDLFRRTTAAKGQPRAEDGNTFAFAPGDAAARAREDAEGFVVLAGSTARRGGSETFPAGYRALRDKLLAADQMTEDSSPQLSRFVTDVIFSSASAAASIVAARSAGGPLEWRLEGTGQTYRDWRAARLDLSPALHPT